jgi:hypothetical protein
VSEIEKAHSADAAAAAVGELVGRLKRAARAGVSRRAREGSA